MMTALAESIQLRLAPPVQQLLRVADTALIHAQRLAEWSGHAPVLEEDIALSNMALDLLGQARLLLTHAAELEGQGFDEDQLAFLREENQFFNLTLAEQPMRRGSAHSPGGDFADTVLRNWLLASWFKPLWLGLQSSTDKAVAGIATKAAKETRYHQQHAADWVLRLGDGTPQSHGRMLAALARAWPYTAEMFADDAVDTAVATSGFAPARSTLRSAWLAEVEPLLAQAALPRPADTPFLSTGTQGVHSEHMGFILAEMQSLQRRHPGGRW
jgi:ring-1,2-phenylacetyl-CoA epoxidase subunit PaaC